jgi:hypothetical protein
LFPTGIWRTRWQHWRSLWQVRELAEGADAEANRRVVLVVGPVGGLQGHRASLGLASGALWTLDRVGVAGDGMPAGGLAALGGDACDRTWLRVAVKPSLLAGLQALDRAAGLPPCLLPFGIVLTPGRLGAKRSVGVAYLEALPVVLERNPGRGVGSGQRCS